MTPSDLDLFSPMVAAQTLLRTFLPSPWKALKALKRVLGLALT